MPIRTFLIVFALLAAAQPQSVNIPDTPAGHTLKAWLDAFNRGDREAYRDFLQKNFPSRAEHLDEELDFRERTGGFELRKVEESTPAKLVALLQERISDQFARLTLETETAATHRITNMELRAIPRPRPSH